MTSLDTSTAKLTKQLKALKGLTPKSLLAGAFVLEYYAKENAPVKSGALKSSGHSRETEKGAEVVFDVNYAAYVELGTKNTPANGFVRRAIDEHDQDIVKAVGEQIEKDIKEKGGL